MGEPEKQFTDGHQFFNNESMKFLKVGHGFLTLTAKDPHATPHMGLPLPASPKGSSHCRTDLPRACRASPSTPVRPSVRPRNNTLRRSGLGTG